MRKSIKQVFFIFLVAILDITISYYTATTRYIDKMPKVYKDNFDMLIGKLNDNISYLFGSDYFVILVALVSIVIYYFFQKFVFKSRKSFAHYLVIFIILNIVSSFAYRVGLVNFVY